MNKESVFCLLLVCLMCGCKHVFEYHPYDVKLKESYKHINEKNIARIQEQDRSADTICFAFMGDTQRWYDETEDFVKHINARSDIDFVVHGGDISDFGMKNEFCWIHDIMSKLKVPYVALIGNHDHLGSGGEIYKTMYGDLNFAFIYARIKFLCLNTNALEFDYSTPVPDFQFIRKELADSVNENFDRTIAMMHVPPENVVFNNNVKEVFHEYLKRYPQLLFCVHAHNHELQVNQFFNDGIVYYGSDAMVNRNYLLFSVTEKGYTYEVVYF